MNTHLWYLASEKSTNLDMPYTAWKDFQCRLTTVDNLSIEIDFGDGILQTVPGNNVNFTYSKATTTEGVVSIKNANRLLRMSFGDQGFAIHRTPFVFSLAVLRIASNLLTLNFISGNISGDASNLSPVLQTFQLLQFTNGIVTNLQPLPSTLLAFNQTGTESNFNFVAGQIASEMPNLTTLVLYGKSRVVDDVSNLPLSIRVLEISNTSLLPANRRHRLTYSTSRVWANNRYRFILDCEDGFGLDSDDLDRLLIDLATRTWTNFAGNLIRLTNGHGVRTSASDAAVATLSALPNVTLQLN